MYTTVSARLDARLKEEAEAVLSALGISHSAAIAALYSQIVFQQGLPFDVRIPRKNARMGLSYWELRDAVRGIAESCEVRAVWLYGPYATGAADAGSSIDLRIDAEEGSGGIADKVELVVDDVELHEHRRTADDGDIDAGELFQRLKLG